MLSCGWIEDPMASSHPTQRIWRMLFSWFMSSYGTMNTRKFYSLSLNKRKHGPDGAHPHLQWGITSFVERQRIISPFGRHTELCEYSLMSDSRNHGGVHHLIREYDRREKNIPFRTVTTLEISLGVGNPHWSYRTINHTVVDQRIFLM